MKNKKILTENNNGDSQEYDLSYLQTYQSNPNIKSYNNNKFKISKKIINFNNSFASNDTSLKNFTFNKNKTKNKENNFSKILKMLDEEIKKSLEYKSEINSLKKTINSKNKEIKILNNKINSLIKNIINIKKENIIKYQKNQTFYKNFIDIINNFKQGQKMINVSFPIYSLKDAQAIKNGNIISTIKLLIKTIIDLCNNTNNNITQFNILKDKINSFNESFTEDTKKKSKEMNSLKMQNLKLKKILEQNIVFLKELRDENYILKLRNLKLEKNINLISKSGVNMRKKLFMPLRINYYSSNNTSLNKTEDNINNKNNISINNISINTSKTNKTSTDILIEEFQDKENKIKQLHKLAHKIYKSENKSNK